MDSSPRWYAHGRTSARHSRQRNGETGPHPTPPPPTKPALVPGQVEVPQNHRPVPGGRPGPSIIPPCE
eukprot:5888276-Pyramimonas_sp.AAC.1